MRLQATGSFGVLHIPSDTRSCKYLTPTLLEVGLLSLRQRELMHDSVDRQSLFSPTMSLFLLLSVNGIELIYDTTGSHVS